MKRLIALLAGALGIRALLRRRSGAAPAAEDLRAKLAASRTVEEDRAPFEAGETPVDEAVDLPPAGVDERRADVHARARQAMDDLSS